jgi:hypothetical protein
MDPAQQAMVDALVAAIQRLTGQLPDQAPTAADYLPPQE